MVDNEKKPPRSSAIAVAVLVLLILASAAICIIVWVLPVEGQQMLLINKIARACLPFVLGVAFLVLASIIGNSRRRRDYLESAGPDSLFSDPKDDNPASSAKPEKPASRKVRSLMAQLDEIIQAINEDEDKISFLDSQGQSRKTINRIHKLEDDRYFLIKDKEKIERKIAKLTGSGIPDEETEEEETQDIEDVVPSPVIEPIEPIIETAAAEPVKEEPEPALQVAVTQDEGPIDRSLEGVTFEPEKPLASAFLGNITAKAVPSYPQTRPVVVSKQEIENFLSREKLGFAAPLEIEFEPVIEPAVQKQPEPAEALVEKTQQQLLDEALEDEMRSARANSYDLTIVRAFGESFALESLKAQLEQIGDGFMVSSGELVMIIPFYDEREAREALRDSELKLEIRSALAL
ncbi:MAG: hypothetical protein PHI83_03710 [Sphaerochaetaceae bacterium]|jgi:hypothetical protein|nr:hypothetical protein [Sphaerochaetaceae bacterium]